MKFDKRQIILFSIIVAMIVGFFFIQYLPTMSAIKEAEKLKLQGQQEQNRADQYMQKLPVMQNQLANLKSEIGDFSKKIPDQRDFGSFLQDVTSIMTKHSLQEQLVKPGNEKTYSKLNCIPVTMECSGSLENIYGFFKDIELSSRLFRLEDVRFENNKYSGNVKVYANGSIFYKKEI